VLHLCARDGNLDGLRCLLGPDTGAMYTPICNTEEPKGVTALQVAIEYQFKDCAAVLWQHLSPSLNETTARHAIGTLALLASKRTTSMLVLPFLRDSADSITRELVSFRATIREPIACVLPSTTLSKSQLAVKNEKDQTIQTIQLWREHDLLPKPKPDDVTPVKSQVVLLPGLCDDPHRLKMHERAFHLIVENCDASVFANPVIKMTVDFKWTHNVRKIVLVHLAGYGLSLLVATAGMVASTQSSWNIACPSCWIPSVGVDALQIAVIVCEAAALLNETMQIYRQKAQYMQDGGGWNLVDVFTSACLITAAISHFSGDPETIRTFGSIGVACKWFGCETAHLPASMLLCVFWLPYTMSHRLSMCMSLCVCRCRCLALHFMRAFGNTGPFVRMIYVISRDLAWFGAIAIVFLLASASFFLISDGDKPEFALDQVVIGPVWRECPCHPDLQEFLS
jgi:hypothetical protein